MIGTALLAAAAAAAAQPLTICADRPGKSSQTCTVPAGHVQLELGLGDWTLAKTDGERDTTLVLGQLAVKYGLTDRSHIEVVVTPWQRVTSRGGGRRASDGGFGDVLLVYKQLVTGAGAPVQVAVSPFVKAPTARRPLGNGRWEGGVVVPIQYAIPRSTLALTVAPELDWAADGDGHGHHAVTAQVANLAWQATPRLILSGEIWGQWDFDPGGTERQASADVAVTYLTSNRVQLDAGANFGLNPATPDVDLYCGVSVLF